MTTAATGTEGPLAAPRPPGGVRPALRIDPVDVPEPVTVVFDVRSPWCYQTTRWMRQLEAAGLVTLSWGVFSLEAANLTDEEDPEAYAAEFGPAQRVALALRERDGEPAIGDFYAAIGRLMWEIPVSTEDEALPAPSASVADLTRAAAAAIGVDGAFVDTVLADPATWTAVLAEHRRWVENHRVFGVPTLVFGDGEDRVTQFGPVLRELPDEETALELWRHVRGLLAFGTVYELKRDKPLSLRTGLPAAVWRANLRVADMRAARELMKRDSGLAEHSLEWAMAVIRARRTAASGGPDD